MAHGPCAATLTSISRSRKENEVLALGYIMNINLITNVLESGDKAAIRALFEDDSTVFWVDWKEGEGDIVRYCEAVLKTGSLTAEWVRADTPRGRDLYISYDGRRIRAPLINGYEDRHIALCALNQALAPEYELRFCIDSNGSDTLAFVPLSAATWTELEQRYGAAVSRHFYRLTERPNLFTDALPF
jgi:hypothetical protein